ncbi:phytanoyl-CoA dioxygenase family protein [Tautonia plasticadhaerens]|uniref:Phytanoyl-CoA dioxygenase (PhyH) n=1 Tax=Tautonia plasticadhaerens TaxID=2527974 RepID=A0A518GX00_9BACT|nr:phytanoyl-CoA dioxygenase family protein [Tautonia plasticadhaerens]QDV33119.1 Phytanoyl-CoA dioxygenase (PhyH) [Tautonia plasticadhaerens]
MATVTDLSRASRPVGSLFSRNLAEDPDRFRLSDDQVRFFEENGYLPGVRILDDDQVEALRAELAEWFDPDHPGRELWYEYHSNESADPDRVLFHALGAWRIKPGFHDILWNPAFAVPASQLLGGAVRFWHDQLFCKPAKHGGVVAWHQDYSYWTRTVPMAHLTCWIGLDDSTIDNGCVHYVPGSHRWPLLPITELAGDMDGIREALDDEQWAMFQEPVAVELKAGEATFHHPLMVHGSFANRTDRPRRATVINAFRDGVRSDSDATLLEGVPPIPKGRPMDGPFFPLLYDPAGS